MHVMNIPSWAESERFDITAGGNDPTTVDANRVRLRRLLEDRFRLRVHTELRSMASYSLTVIRSRAPGPGLRPAAPEIECDDREAAGRPEPSVPAEWSCVVRPTRNGFAGGALTMAQVARYIGALGAQFGGLEDTTVTDATGLIGRFAVTFDYSWQDAAAVRAEANVGREPNSPTAVTAAVVDAFRRAVEDQLGLRLVTAMRPVDVLVIDHIERGSEN